MKQKKPELKKKMECAKTVDCLNGTVDALKTVADQNMICNQPTRSEKGEIWIYHLCQYMKSLKK